MKTKLIVLLLLTCSIGFAQKAKKPVAKPMSKTAVKPAAKSQDGLFVEFETAKGKMVVQLEYQKAPITVANFVALVEGNHPNVSDEKLKGKPFYNGFKAVTLPEMVRVVRGIVLKMKLFQNLNLTKPVSWPWPIRVQRPTVHSFLSHTKKHHGLQANTPFLGI